MIDTIEKALRPTSLVIFFLGFGILGHPLKQSRYHLNIFYNFYILIVWSVYAYALYCTILMFSLEKLFSCLLTLFIVPVNLFIAVISIIINICEQKKYRQYLRKLELVDDTLEKFGIPKEYHKMRNLTRQALIVWFLITCASWTLDSLLCLTLYNDAKAMLITYVTTYVTHVNSTIDITFILLLRYIGTRLDTINGYFEQLLETEDCGLRCKWKKSLVVNAYYVKSAKNRKHIFWTMIHLHLELCRRARDINEFFGIQITLQMISYFVICNGMFYFEYYTILHPKEMYKNNTALYIKIFLSTDMWFITSLMKLISLNYICESVSTKAQKTKIIIHKLANLVYFAEVREEIYQFVLQMSLRPLKFSGWGLFYFGYGFIRKFLLWNLTTIIFLSQRNIIPVRIYDQNLNYNRDNMTYYNK